MSSVCFFQGLSFHLGAVLLSLGFITYVEHGKNNILHKNKANKLQKLNMLTKCF